MITIAFLLIGLGCYGLGYYSGYKEKRTIRLKKGKKFWEGK